MVIFYFSEIYPHNGSMWLHQGVLIFIIYLLQALVTQMSCPAVTNPAALTAEEYFNPGTSPTQRDIGHPCQLTTKTQR